MFNNGWRPVATVIMIKTATDESPS